VPEVERNEVRQFAHFDIACRREGWESRWAGEQEGGSAGEQERKRREIREKA
jgi:hypothetical protein